MIKSNAMPTKQDVGSRIKMFNEIGESKYVRSGGGCPQGWSYSDPTLKTVESMPEVETHEITQDEMPSQSHPQEVLDQLNSEKDSPEPEAA